jgi:hypothetical protein
MKARQSVLRSVWFGVAIVSIWSLSFSTKATATPLLFSGAGTLNAAIISGPDVPPRWIQGTMQGTVEFLVTDLTPDPGAPGTSFFNFVLQGWFSGSLTDNGSATPASAHYVVGGFGRYSPGATNQYGVISGTEGLSNLTVGAESLGFFNTVYGPTLGNGLFLNGQMSVATYISSVWPNGVDYSFEQFGRGGRAELTLTANLAQAGVPEPTTAILLLAAFPLLRRSKRNGMLDSSNA